MTEPLVGSEDRDRPQRREPHRILRVCSSCGRPLTVGERMFYFFDATNDPAVCRRCVTFGDRDAVSESSPKKNTLREGVATALEAVVRGPSTEFEGQSTRSSEDAVRRGLEEIDRALRALPHDDPLGTVIRRLNAEAQRRWRSGQVTEAARIVDRLQVKLAELDLLEFPSSGRPSIVTTTSSSGKPGERHWSVPASHHISLSPRLVSHVSHHVDARVGSERSEADASPRRTNRS